VAGARDRKYPLECLAAATLKDCTTREDCLAYGLVLHWGLGVAADANKAAGVLEKACTGKDREKCAELAAASKDAAVARALFGHACTGGVAAACTGLGEMFFNGKGVPVDKAAAREAYVKGCEAEDGLGCFSAGYLASRGEGGPEDKTAARALYRKGCDFNHPTACYNGGLMALKGEGGAEDKVAARRMFVTGCDLRDATACFNAAVMVGEGKGGNANRAQAREYFARGCKLGEPASCGHIAWDQWGQGEEADAESALDTACRPAKGRGEPNEKACFQLGLIRQFFGKDRDAAAAAFAEACTLGLPAGCLQQAALLRVTDKAAAGDLAKGALERAEKACEDDALACLAVADWYKAAGDKAKGKAPRAKGREGLGTQCDDGDKAACRLAKVR
jgi:TPR repeat protein